MFASFATAIGPVRLLMEFLEAVNDFKHISTFFAALIIGRHSPYIHLVRGVNIFTAFKTTACLQVIQRDALHLEFQFSKILDDILNGLTQLLQEIVVDLTKYLDLILSQSFLSSFEDQ